MKIIKGNSEANIFFPSDFSDNANIQGEMLSFSLKIMSYLLRLSQFTLTKFLNLKTVNLFLTAGE